MRSAFGKKRSAAANVPPPQRPPAYGADRAAEPPAPPADDLHAVLSLQSAEGSFGWDDRLAALVQSAGGDAWRPTVEAVLPAKTTGASGALRDSVIHTFLALLLLETKFADRDALWRRAARKAARYLAQSLGWSADDVQARLGEMLGRK